MDDYNKYRGKCKEYSEKAIIDDPTLTLVRGYYWCPIWGKQQHWWTVRENGEIYDPTVKQFPSKGMGEYEAFDGMVECSECGISLKEEDARIDGRYTFCSVKCNMNFCGIYNT